MLTAPILSMDWNKRWTLTCLLLVEVVKLDPLSDGLQEIHPWLSHLSIHLTTHMISVSHPQVPHPAELLQQKQNNAPPARALTLYSLLMRST